MDFLFGVTPVQAAAIDLGLLIVVMLALKMYVGNRRGALKVPSGETTPEFSRITRVQMNAVEDVPVLMAGILGLGVLNMPAWYIHMCGLTLVVARLLHATGLARSSGFSPGRLAGTLGSMLVYLAVAGALLVHGFAGQAAP
jgi:uncharacterized membrane protein YecN with MAPEG domain